MNDLPVISSLADYRASKTITLWIETKFVILINLTDVWLSLKGSNVSNNSDVLITDIGEGNEALWCRTTFRSCCKLTKGEWYFPNGSMVRINMASDSFYRNRGSGVVRLHRRNDAMMPTGQFCCILPQNATINQTLCANIGMCM